MNNSRDNYEIFFDRLEVVSYDGKTRAPILGNFTSINIYESILSPLITCTIDIYDVGNLLEKFPLVHQKNFIEMEYRTRGYSGNDKPIKRRFFINEIAGRTFDQTLKVNTYTLKCISEEIIESANKIISESVIDEEISSVVKRVFKNYIKSKKPLIVENTKGLQNLQLLNLKPLEAIEYLRRNAISVENFSNSFIFFENSEGFYFVTLEGLMDKIGEADDENTSIFYLERPNVKGSFGSFRNILGYQNLVDDEALSIVSSGSSYSLNKRIDIATGVIETFEIKPQLDNFRLSVSGKDVASTLAQFELDTTKKPAKAIFSVHDSNQNETYIYNKIFSDYYFEMCLKHIIRIYVHGDASIKCGGSVDIRLPDISSDTKTKIEMSRLSSGQFLISKVRHMINVQQESTFSYHMSMELIRPSYGESLS